MAKKKLKKKLKKKVSKKKVVRKKVSRSKPVRATKGKIRLTFKNFLVFLILAALSYVLDFLVAEGFWSNVLFSLMILFSIISLAFLVVLLVLFFLRVFNK